MKKFLQLHSGVFVILCIVLFCNRSEAQVIKKAFNFGPPKIVNLHNLAELEKKNPVVLKPRFIEQGEDRDNFIFKPLPVKPGAKVNNIQVKAQDQVTQAAQSTSPAPTQNFHGVLDNGTLIPPDINGAAGTSYVVETTNQQFNIYTKSSGALAATVTIATLFSPSGLSGYYDPHIVYDPNYNRFIIAIDAQTGTSSSAPSAFALAISQTGDPTGNWYIYSVVTTPSAPTDFMDYDQLGFNNNWIVMTGNDFPTSGSNSSHIYVWPRATLYAGTAGTATTFVDTKNILISPATTYDVSQNTEYMVSDYNGNSGGNGYVNVETITGTASAPVYSAGSQLGINQPWQDPSSLVKAPESGETKAKGIEAGDTRIHSVIYRNGSLWFTHTVFLPASGTITNSAVDWWQINPSALSVTQFDRITDPNKAIWYYYPSLDVNANGDMLVGFSNSSSTTYCGAQYALKTAADAANSVETPYQFISGVAGYYKTYGGGRNRWGDYTGTAFDPTDGSFWTFQEWANSGNNWGTQVAHVPDAAATACATPTSTSTNSITNTSATFNWTAVSGVTGYNVQYRVVGASTWTTANVTTNTYNVTTLTAGTNYEWQVQSVCSATSTSVFSSSVTFTTTGGCTTPSGLAASSISTTSASLAWTAVAGATGYNLQWKATSSSTFTTVSGLTTNSYNLTGLTAGTAYQFQVQTICSGGTTSAYSSPTSFTTSSGTVTYCASTGNTTYEYINKVALGSINNTSGNNNGYGNYTSLSTSLAAGSAYTITLTPGFTGSSYTEYWTVYIDYNHDGTLNGTGETVAKVSGSAAKSVSFTVPATAKNGSTRMRIQMHYGSSSTNPCATLNYGEVEDYTVNITNGTKPVEVLISDNAVSELSLQNALSIIPNPVSATSYATANYHLAKEGNTVLKVVDAAGKILYVQSLGLQNAGQHNYLLYNLTVKLHSGYYFALLEQNNAIVARNRFIVSK